MMDADLAKGVQTLRNAAVGLTVAMVSVACAVSGAAAQENAEKAAADAARSAWVKICDKVPVSAEERKDICITHHERLDGNTGAVLVSAAIRQVEDSDQERFMVMVPLGMALGAGVQVRFDDENEPIKMEYSICHPGGCTAEMPSSDEIVSRLRKGNQLVVAAIEGRSGKAIGFPVPLQGFTAAYEGGPVDSAKYAQARRRLMSAIIDRQRQARQAQIDAAKKAAAEATGEASAQ